jgi:phage terminase large subunit-like protein
MTGVLAAAEAANVLLSLGLNAIQASQQIHDMIAKAQAENRDLTDAELQSAIDARHAAEQAMAAAMTRKPA